MAWIRYEVKRKIFPTDIVRASKTELKFSAEVWEKYLKKSEAMGFMFDPETNQIGLIPCNKKGGLKITERGLVCRVMWGGFLKQFNLYFEKPEDYKIQPTLGDKTMIVISLNERGVKK